MYSLCQHLHPHCVLAGLRICAALSGGTSPSTIARGCCANTYQGLEPRLCQSTELQPGILPGVFSKITTAALAPAHVGPAAGSDEEPPGAAVCVGSGRPAAWAHFAGALRSREGEQGSCSPHYCCVSTFSEEKGSREAACLHKQSCLSDYWKGTA